MKLYTEEQVREAIKMAREGVRSEDNIINSLNFIKPTIELPNDSLCVNCDESKSIHNVCMDCIIKIGKENIQLPSDKQQHEQTWIAALDYGIGKMKGLNDLESKDAFEQYYNETYGGNK
jgi:hypothetical protein